MSDTNNDTNGNNQVDTSDFKYRYEESQRFIETLKTEKREEKEAQDAKIKALEDQLKSDEFTKKITDDKGNLQETPPGDQPKVEDVVNEILNKRAVQEQAVANVRDFDTFMLNQFGSEEAAIEAVKNKATEMGKSAEQLQQLVKTEPALMKSLFTNTVSQNKGTQIPGSGTVNTLNTPNLSDAETQLMELKTAMKKEKTLLGNIAFQKNYREVYKKAKGIT